MARGWSPQQVRRGSSWRTQRRGDARVSRDDLHLVLPSAKGELKRSLLAGLRQGKEHRGLERRGHYGRHRIADMVSSTNAPPRSPTARFRSLGRRSHDWQGGPLRGGDTCGTNDAVPPCWSRCHKDAPQSPPAWPSPRPSSLCRRRCGNRSPGIKELSWLSIGQFTVDHRCSRGTSLIPDPHGSEGPTRIPTASSASTYPALR